VLELGEVARDPGLATAAGRLARADPLERRIAERTATRERFELESALQRAGVAASVVQNSAELVRDPQLAERGHFVELEHPSGRPTFVEGSRFRLSRTPARIEKLAPTLGRDSEHVLREVLGYDDERIAELVIAGALE
jgi:benzylsuccinate CoA-transferase BbsF subunit